MRRSLTWLLAACLLACWAGCGSDPDNTRSDDDDRSGDDKKTDRDRKDDPKEEPARGDCECDPGLVCDEQRDRCVPVLDHDEGEFLANISVLAFVGEGALSQPQANLSANFFALPDLPRDTRQEYSTDDNEPCFLERGDNARYPIAGQYLAVDEDLSAGDLTVEIEGLDPIVIEKYKTAGYSRTIDDGEVPLGASIEVTTGGGEFGKHTFSGEMPEDFEITRPQSEASEDSGKELGISWSEPQASATILITLTVSGASEGTRATLTCQVADDGSAMIPADAVRQVAGEVSLELRRIIGRYRKVDADGETLHAYLYGYRGRLRTFTLE